MENGVKILNLQGSDILKNNLENRAIIKQYSAVFANSLVSDKLYKLEMKGDKTTRDIINVKFDYGYTNLKGEKMDKDMVRIQLYRDGFHLDFYKTVKKEKVFSKRIEYVFWFRTSAKARVGQCYFINKKFYNKIFKWQTMNIKLPEKNAKLVEYNAYLGLTASSIVTKLKINPNKILVVNDIDSFKEEMCTVIKTDLKNECIAEDEEVTVKNTLWDGMMLLESKIFEQSKETENASFALLRQHMFKAAAFRTYIQKFYKDYCQQNGLDYETYQVEDRYGNKMLAKDVQAITTENAMKWEKFFNNKGQGFKRWKQKVAADNSFFGVCKTDHDSKFGNLQRTSYQMLNSLELNQDQVNELSKDNIEYVNTLKDDNNEFSKFLSDRQSFVGEEEMMSELAVNDKFNNTDFFKKYKAAQIYNYIRELRTGKLKINANNLTMISNPYLLLLYSITDNDNRMIKDETLKESDEYISVYTKRFKNNEMLAAFRNPHNAPNNIAYLKNQQNDLLDKYFNFNSNIIVVNCINNAIQDRLNGCDFDSDFVFVTNNAIVVKYAAYAYKNYFTIVNQIEKSTRTYNNSVIELAQIDNMLAESKNAIGETSNLAQIALSYYVTSKDAQLLKNVCILSVLAQVAIDNAKRQYLVDINAEIDRLAADINKDHLIKINNRYSTKKPYFFKILRDDIKKERLEKTNCTMDLLQNSLNSIKNSERTELVKMIDLLKNAGRETNNRQVKIIKDIISETADKSAEIVVNEELNKKEKAKRLMNLESEMIQNIRKYKLKQDTMIATIRNALTIKTKLKLKIVNSMYQYNKEMFYNCFK